MLRSKYLAVAFAGCLALAPMYAVAGDDPKTKQDDAKQGDAKKVTPEQLQAWGKQLDSDSHAEREEATRKLKEAGKPAVETLLEAAEGKSAEASSRAFDVLKHFHQQSKDKETQAEAKKVLEKLAKSKQARVSRRATEALKPADEKEPEDPNAQQGVLRIQGMNLQFNVQPGGLQPQPKKKPKKVEVEDAGKKIEITQDKDGITVKVTEKQGKDKKEKSTVYKAKDLKELKKKHPDAAKLYEKHGQALMLQDAEEEEDGQMEFPAMELQLEMAPR